MIMVAKYGLKIYNLHYDKPPSSAVYVGRPTTFGNPYTHLKGDTAAIYKAKTIQECIELYKEYAKRNEAIPKLAKQHLKGKSLVCWCAPQPCHARVLMDLANEEPKGKKK